MKKGIALLLTLIFLLGATTVAYALAEEQADKPTAQTDPTSSAKEGEPDFPQGGQASIATPQPIVGVKENPVTGR